MVKEFTIKKFGGKRRLWGYLKEKFKEAQVILIHGSAAYKPLKNFSDVDLEVYGGQVKKPYYEIVFIKNKPTLLTAYFYKYQKGEKKPPPWNIRIIKGEYTTAIEQRKPQTMYSEVKYSTEEKRKRECQLVADFCFKYIRSKEKLYLQYIQKRIV